MSRADETIEPERDESAEARADELFVHGLLRSQTLDDEAALSQRVDAVMAALDAPAIPRVRRRWPLFLLGAAAASVLAYFALRSVSGPTEIPSRVVAPIGAAARIEAARNATQQLGDRRYSVAAWLAGEDAPVMRGELDLRGSASYLLRVEFHGVALTTGAESLSPWFLGDAQMIAHLHDDPRASLMFAQQGEPRFLLTPDALLARVVSDYAFSEPARAALAGYPGVAFQHVIAHRVVQDDLPDRIEAWIDESSGLLRHLALRWFLEPEHEPVPFDHRDLPRTEHVMLFELAERTSFPPDWFRAERHPR